MDEIKINIHNLEDQEKTQMEQINDLDLDYAGRADYNNNGEAVKTEVGKQEKRYDFAKYILMCLTFLLPIWVLPWTAFPLEINKTYLAFVLIAISAILWIITDIKKGIINIPKSFILLSIILIAIVWLLSSIFSSNFELSFMGTGYRDTFVSIAFLGVLAILFSIIFQKEKDAIRLYYLMFGAAMVVFIFQFFRTILNIKILPFGVFANRTSNLIGGWNEVGIFFGFIALESLILFELMKGKGKRWFFVLTLVASLLGMAVVNFSNAWLVFGILSIVLLTYLFSFLKNLNIFSRIPLFIVIISFLFIVSQSLINEVLTASNINFVEIRPSWQSTMDIIKKSLEEKPIFGSGPNTFAYDWMRFRPQSINSTAFWDARFQNGIGLIPTFFVTTGILGIISWIAFFVFLFGLAIKTLSISQESKNYVPVIATLFGAIYLWVFAIIYIPGIAIFSLAFAMTGLLVGLLTGNGKIKNIELNLISGPKVKFVSALMIIAIIIASTASFYVLTKKYAAAYFFAKGINSFNSEGNADKTEKLLKRANAFSVQDESNRALAELGLIKLQQLLNNQNSNADELRANFQNTLQNTITFAQTAVDQNKLDPLNWMQLGKVYEAIVPFKITGASDMSLNSYSEALKRDPLNPNYLISSARTSFQIGDSASAKKYLEEAIKLKQDFVPAHFMLAQVEANLGNTQEAIKRAGDAQFLSPNDIGILFQLGFLYYQDQNFELAKLAFERAVSINQNYSNARYFLGLIYDKSNERGKALEQFKKIEELNPTNEEVKKIIKNLANGKRALDGISPPGPSPEKRNSPPLQERQKTEGGNLRQVND